MFSKSFARDIGSYITTRFADQIDAVAAGAGDATESDGEWVNRRETDPANLNVESAKLVIAWEAVLGATETLSLAANIQDATASDGTGAADYGDALANAVVATGGAGGSTERGVTELDVNLEGANQFIRSQITPDLSAANTDTARIQAIWVFPGGESYPAS